MRVLTEPADMRLLMSDFEQEINEISNMHRYLVRSTSVAFTESYDRHLDANNPESYDGGDAIWDAEQELGVTPWDVNTHSGLMAISRTVALCEVMFARMAAGLIADPERWIFPKGGLWLRDWEAQFYKTALVTPFKIESAQFGAMRGLRDLYTHGYGVPASEERRQKLARKLYNACDTSPATPAEAALDIGESVYFFGEGAEFSSSTQVLETKWLDSMRADISPLGAHRLIEMARAHVSSAKVAIDSGLVSDLTATGCKFVATVNRWWDKAESTA